MVVYDIILVLWRQPGSNDSLRHLRWFLKVLLSSNDVDARRPHREGTEVALVVTFSFVASAGSKVMNYNIYEKRGSGAPVTR